MGSEADMVIASRTPEGTPNRCPVCGNDLKVEPSQPTRDAPCPHCGHLLWFAPEKPLPERQMMLDCVLRVVTARFGPPSPATRAAIESQAEPERLKAILERVLTCATLEELLSCP